MWKSRFESWIKFGPWTLLEFVLSECSGFDVILIYFRGCYFNLCRSIQLYNCSRDVVSDHPLSDTNPVCKGAFNMSASTSYFAFLRKFVINKVSNKQQWCVMLRLETVRPRV